MVENARCVKAATRLDALMKGKMQAGGLYWSTCASRGRIWYKKGYKKVDKFDVFKSRGVVALGFQRGHYCKVSGLKKEAKILYHNLQSHRARVDVAFQLCELLWVISSIFILLSRNILIKRILLIFMKFINKGRKWTKKKVKSNAKCMGLFTIIQAHAIWITI